MALITVGSNGDDSREPQSLAVFASHVFSLAHVLGTSFGIIKLQHGAVDDKQAGETPFIVEDGAGSGTSALTSGGSVVSVGL